jgi:hypothetical protein
MPRTTATATILAGQSISSSIDLSAGTAVFIHMPMAWTSALLSFQISYDNSAFGDLVDETGHEIAINILPGTVIRALLIPPRAGWLRFRSGSRSGAVIQPADRTITITIDA